jgi:hypothetical protein
LLLLRSLREESNNEENVGFVMMWMWRSFGLIFVLVA